MAGGNSVKSLQFQNIRSFKHATLEFARGINILIGANNSGKSTILLLLLGVQNNLHSIRPDDLRIGTEKGWVHIDFEKLVDHMLPERCMRVSVELLRDRGVGPSLVRPDQQFRLFPDNQPDNFIIPFLSPRKVAQYKQDTMRDWVRKVFPDFRNIHGKIADAAAGKEFREACETIFNFPITSGPGEKGTQAAHRVSSFEHIPLESMGAGLVNILGLLVDLVGAKGKLFLIEEPENDIHPQVLKVLLDFMIDKAADNQFIVTTHSNIVLKRLGTAQESKIFQVHYHPEERVPFSIVTEVESTAEERGRILCDLGYEMYDVDMWEAWLILEESSAQKLVEAYFIPWFVPALCTKLKVYSAHSVSEVKPRFKAFQEVFVFLHLQPIYKNRAWVVIDSGEEERKVIHDLRSTYKDGGWEEDHFRQLQKHDFEEYYPRQFAEKFAAIKQIKDKQQRRKAKRELLQNVEQWIADDHDQAREAFGASASEIVDILKEIEETLARKGEASH